MNERYKEVKTIMVDIWRSVFSVRENTFKESNVRKSLAFSNHHEVRAAIMLNRVKVRKVINVLRIVHQAEHIHGFVKCYMTLPFTTGDHKLLKV